MITHLLLIKILFSLPFVGLIFFAALKPGNIRNSLLFSVLILFTITFVWLLTIIYEVSFLIESILLTLTIVGLAAYALMHLETRLSDRNILIKNLLGVIASIAAILLVTIFL